jgi:hypothetical protein
MQAAMLAWVRHDGRRLGFHAHCPLTGAAETEVLGFGVYLPRVARRARGAVGLLGQIRWCHETTPKTSEVGTDTVKAPTADENRRRGSTSAEGARASSRSVERAKRGSRVLLVDGCAATDSAEARASE